MGIKQISKKTGNEYPVEVDHFVVDDEVKAKFGPQPKTLPVMLPVENEEMILRQSYRVYGGNQRLLCQGDGENAERRIDNQTEKMPCPGPTACDFAKDPKHPGKLRCTARTDLMLVIPSIHMGAVYQLTTGSINSDIDIRSGLEMARHLFGRISWVPMEITREERKIADPETGKMNTHWPVRLYPIATIEQVNELRRDTQRILDVTSTYALPEPTVEGPEEDTPVEYIDEDIDKNVAGPKEPAPAPPPPEEYTKESNSKLDFLIALKECKSASEINNLWNSCTKSILSMPGPDRVDLQMARDKRLSEFKVRK